MCAACAMVAATAASGARAGMRAYLPQVVTAKRLRLATAAVLAAAFIGGSVTMSGTAPAPHTHAAAPAAQR